MPALFALSLEVIGNRQLATYAAFGAFAVLVLAGFAGSPRDKLVAHLQLAVVGSVLVIIGTVVGSSTALAAIVTLPVTFAVFFAGTAGPNAASGVTAALLAYVLPASSPGTISLVPDRLAGWWLASVAGALAVLLFPTPAGGGGLRAAIAKLASTLADDIEALARGRGAEQQLPPSVEAKHELVAEFHSTPYSPTGLATADQATANAVELLEWCTSLTVDAASERCDLADAPPATQRLLGATVEVLRECAAVYGGSRRCPDLERLAERRAEEMEAIDHLGPDSAVFRRRARVSFHAQAIANAALAFGSYVVVSAGMADVEWLAAARTRWFGISTGGRQDLRIIPSGAFKYFRVAFRHARLRSTWFINSARGALALSVAVAVADLTNVQHAFWVVLAALLVLRTNATSTGSSALGALLGTAAGFVVGAGFLLAIGTNSTALWVALPIAVLVAGYAPGILPLAVGQAAFTVTVAVLFNLLVPEGWHVGLVRVEDVAIGCAVSVLVGALFWPRGMASVTGDDLADAYRAGSAYLLHAVGWFCGRQADLRDEGLAAVAAGTRLDAALRAFMAERGSKHLPHQDLWRLVGGAMRLRLTANSIARLPRPASGAEEGTADLGERANLLAGFYDQLSSNLGHPRGRAITELAVPVFPDRDAAHQGSSEAMIWLRQHLEDVRMHLSDLVTPAVELAEIRRRPWWR